MSLPAAHSRDQVAEAYRATDVSAPNDAEAFWRHISKTYLRLDKEPRAEYLKLVQVATADLASIADHLSYIDSEIARLDDEKRSQGRLAAVDRYYRLQLAYFADKNRAAQGRIVSFLAKGLEERAMREASYSIWTHFTRLMTWFGGGSPYRYSTRSWLPSTWPGPYDVRSVHDLSNKFLDLSVESHTELRKLYEQDRQEFHRMAAEYISGKLGADAPVHEKISALVARSHILDRRKQLISTMLTHYADGDFLSFVSMAPLQVEGIFGDVCRELGIPESKLDFSSLNDKLAHIEGVVRSFGYFEYYAFKFPVLRNTVAHGDLVDGDLQHTAHMLLLDLLPVCELAVAEELPSMHALAVLDKILRGPDYEQLLEWIRIRKAAVVPTFYGRESQIAQVEALYSTDEFWNFVRKKLESEGPNSGLRELIGLLKNAGIAESRCIDFLRGYGRTIEEIEEKKFREDSSSRKRVSLPKIVETDSSSNRLRGGELGDESNPQV